MELAHLLPTFYTVQPISCDMIAPLCFLFEVPSLLSRQALCYKGLTWLSFILWN